MSDESLKKPIRYLPGVGPTYADRLHKLEIETVEDLIHHYPFRYDDLRKTTQITDLTEGEETTINVSIVSIRNIRTRSGKQLQKAVVADPSGQLEITWFNQPYLVKSLRGQENVALSGTPKTYRGQLTLSAPQYEVINSPERSLNEDLDQKHTGRLVPIYHTTAGVSNKWLRTRIAQILKNDVQIKDYLPETIRSKYQLQDLSEALREIHFPSDPKELKKALERLGFDELFLLQLAAQSRKRLWHQKSISHKIRSDEKALKEFTQSLPFTLTNAQQKALSEILTDLKKPTAMNRLLQGDVGSGKTVVAAAAMYLSFKSGLPSVLMAPTEVLALQHAKTIRALLEPLGVNISTQTRSEKDELENADVYIGTHALLHRQIPKDLGLVVIDEQHRFGVEQRAKLLDTDPVPNLLSMTATPIPRTIALTLYADLDISVIDEMPPGRKPVKTWVVTDKKRKDAYAWIKDQITNESAQAFVVCPLVEDSQTPMLDQVKAAETEYLRLKEDVYKDLELGLVHGRMSSKQKQEAIKEFSQGKSDILVATPVIEVGIDIKNARIMLIEGAERFGLSQLHQLRGRVGRGDKESYCLLFTSSGKRPTKRLLAMQEHHSGFKLAELDLELRGAGEIYGTRQSGHINLKIASLSDQNKIRATHQEASALLENDPDLKNHQQLRQKLHALLEKQALAN